MEGGGTWGQSGGTCGGSGGVGPRIQRGYWIATLFGLSYQRSPTSLRCQSLLPTVSLDRLLNMGGLLTTYYRGNHLEIGQTQVA